MSFADYSKSFAERSRSKTGKPHIFNALLLAEDTKNVLQKGLGILCAAAHGKF